MRAVERLGDGIAVMSPVIDRIVNIAESRDGLLLRRVYDGLYSECFVNPDESTSFSYFFDRLILGSVSEDNFFVNMLVALSESDDVVGFVVSEYYGESSCALITYLAVNDIYRGNGVARTLINSAIDVLLSESSGALLSVFMECHNPDIVSDGMDTFSPTARLAIMKKLGCMYVPINYVQPPLSPEGRPSSDLVLICVVRDEVIAPPSGQIVAGFLKEFYRSLGVVDADSNQDFRLMMKCISRMENGCIDDQFISFSIRHGVPCLGGNAD